MSPVFHATGKWNDESVRLALNDLQSGSTHGLLKATLISRLYQNPWTYHSPKRPLSMSTVLTAGVTREPDELALRVILK